MMIILANRYNNIDPTRSNKRITSKRIYSIGLRYNVIGQVEWLTIRVPLNRYPVDIVINLGEELLGDGIESDILMWKHFDPIKQIKTMIYDCPIIWTQCLDTAVLRYPSPEWKYGVASLIHVKYHRYEVMMIDHDDMIRRLIKYWSMDKAILKVIAQVDFCMKCCTNGETCEVHKQLLMSGAPTRKKIRLCPKFVPRNIHHIHCILQLYHKIAAHDYNCTESFIRNNEECTVCHSHNTLIYKRTYSSNKISI